MFLRFKKTWSVIFVIVVLLLLLTAIDIYHKKVVEENITIGFCTEESRNVDACIEIYQPVCGYPVEQTYSNSCFACIDEEVEHYLEGECE